MKKLMTLCALFLALVMLFACVSCDTSDLGMIEDFTTEEEKPKNYDDLKGSIWKKVRASGAMIGDYIASNEILDQGIPLEFFTEEGLIYKKDNGTYAVNGENQPDNMYNPFHYRAYIDPNSPENDIYLLIQYASKHLGQNEPNPDIYLATYMLKYVLDDDNYKTFLYLDGDRLIKDFIQEMDRQFEEKVIFKSVVAQNLQSLNSHVENEHWTKQGFPNIFVVKVDYNNAIITYGATSPEGLRYFDVDIRISNAWKNSLDKYGITEEERENLIDMSTTSTPVGKCLKKFSVKGLVGGCSLEQAKELYNTTDRRQELEEININAQEKGPLSYYPD